MKRIWDRQRIIRTLRQLHVDGRDLSYNRLSRSMQPLVSAAAYHFGSYRKAVEHAGLDYSRITRRPHWSRPAIIRMIKQAWRNHRDLHWSAVTRRRDPLSRAAFAAIQPRLFGSWNRALHAAGLDADDVSRYRRWDRSTIILELKERHRDDEPVNSGALQQEDPGMHAAALRHFGSYDAALRAARIDPARIRQRRRWTREDVLLSLLAFKRRRGTLADGQLRSRDPALYGAALRYFGNLKQARRAAQAAAPERRHPRSR